MKPRSLRWAGMIAVLFLLASCGGGGGGSNSTACTPTGNMTLHSSNTGTTLLSSVTVSAAYNTSIPDVPVFVAYTSPPVAAIAAGYPPGATDPRTVGMGIIQPAVTANPLEFSLTFDTILVPATYAATWRFVAVDAGANVAGCRDLPVTFTIN